MQVKMSRGFVLVFAMLSTQLYSGKCRPQLAPRTLFYEFMTPQTINRYATYMDSAHTLTATQLTFNAGAKLVNALLLKIPLISAGELSRQVPLTIKIVVGLDTSIGRASGKDTDISYGITDGVSFHGFEYPDQGNYVNHVPCYGKEAKSGLALSNIRNGPYGPGFSGKLYPGQAVITLRPDEQWGSCYTTHDGGFLNYMQYRTRLNLSKGIALEVYKNHKYEKAGIKYIELTVSQGH